MMEDIVTVQKQQLRKKLIKSSAAYLHNMSQYLDIPMERITEFVNGDDEAISYKEMVSLETGNPHID